VADCIKSGHQRADQVIAAVARVEAVKTTSSAVRGETLAAA
jgi:hypothetical protein